MNCPNCGRTVSGGVCESCGAVLRKKPTWLIVIAIVLSVIIAACAVIIIVPQEQQSDVRRAARAYVTAAYYTNKVVETGSRYDSYNAFKKDVNIALNACRVLNEEAQMLAHVDISLFRIAYAEDDVLGGLDSGEDDWDEEDSSGGGELSGVDTDVDQEEADDTAEDIIADMKKAADEAADVLEDLDDAVDDAEDAGELEEAFEDAKDALDKVDKVDVVVGDKEVNFGGVNDLGDVNMSLIGANMMIDGDTVHLGSGNAVVTTADDISQEVVTYGTIAGTIMDTGNMAELLTDGTSVVVDLSDSGDEPDTQTFDDPAAYQAYVSDEVSQYLGFNLGDNTEDESETFDGMDEDGEPENFGNQDTGEGDIFELIDTGADWDDDDDGVYPDTEDDDPESFGDQDTGDDQPVVDVIPEPTQVPQPTPQPTDNGEQMPSDFLEMVGEWKLFKPSNPYSFTSMPGSEYHGTLKIYSDGTGIVNWNESHSPRTTTAEFIERGGGLDMKIKLGENYYTSYPVWLDGGYLYFVHHMSTDELSYVGVRQ